MRDKGDTPSPQVVVAGARHDGPVPRPQPVRSVGRPAVTSRTQILTAARAIIDRDGWERLSLRRLAGELGIGTSTLYRHVRDREDLLIQLINDHASRAEAPDLPSEPRERIVAAAVAMHDLLSVWPWAAEALTADGFLTQLDEEAIGLVEAVVSAALAEGLDHEAAVHLLRCLWYYTVGEILVRVHTVDRAVGVRSGEEGRFGAVDAAQVPGLSAIGEETWRAVSAEDRYALGVRQFVDGLLGS